MKIESTNYTILVVETQIDGDRLFEARVREFPHFIVYANSAAEVFEDAGDLLADVVADFEKKGAKLPDPIVRTESSEHNGRFTVRAPKTLHHKLSESAAADGVSLNLYVVSLLSSSISAPYEARVKSGDESWVLTNSSNQPKMGKVQRICSNEEDYQQSAAY